MTPEGDIFSGIQQWKESYIKRPDMLAEAFAKQLITYATGAGPRFGDRRDVARIVELARGEHHGIKTIIHAVVASDAFRIK